MSTWIVTNLEILGKTREAIMEATFLNAYGSPLLQAVVGLKASHAAQRVRHDFAAKTRVDFEAAVLRGGFLEASLRALLYVLRGKGADERQFNALEALRNSAPENERLSLSQVKEILRQQAALLRFDEGRAIAAISKMLPNDPGRRALALAAIYNVITAIGEPDLDMVRRFQDISRLFESTDLKREAFSGQSHESVRPE